MAVIHMPPSKNAQILVKYTHERALRIFRAHAYILKLNNFDAPEELPS